MGLVARVRLSHCELGAWVQNMEIISLYDGVRLHDLTIPGPHHGGDLCTGIPFLKEWEKVESKIFEISLC